MSLESKGNSFMKHVKIANTSDVLVGHKLKVTLEGKDIMLTNLGGTYYAMDNTCPHMGGSLSDGRIEGTSIVCPRHGAAYDIVTGQAVKDAKILFITSKVHNVHIYPVKVEETEIFINLE